MANSFLTVWLQIIFIWCIIIRVYILSAKSAGRAPIDDIGVLLLVVFGLYTTLPPLSWLLQGGIYTPLSGRLFRLQPETSQVIFLLNISLAYIIGFTLVYISLMKNVNKPLNKVQAYIGDTKALGAISILLITYVLGFVIGGMGLIRAAESYTDSYAAYAELPLGIRQIIKISTAFSSVAGLVLLVALFQRWPRYRWLFFLYLFSLLFSFNAEGSRTGLAINLLSIAIAWHVLVRPIPTTKVIIGGILGLAIFLLLGILRSIGSFGEAVGGGLGVGIGVGEFDEVWANAIELFQEKGAVSIPFSTRFSELFEFIPSQLLWFQKDTLSNWYMDTFYPVSKESGAGLAFGAIGQAVVGGGIIEAFIRGLILGGLAGFIIKWYRKSSGAWWHFPLYLYMLIWIYQSVRNTTFSLLGSIVQTVFPALLAITLIGFMFEMQLTPKKINARK